MLENADRNNLRETLKTKCERIVSQQALGVLCYDEAIAFLLLDSINRYIEYRIQADKIQEDLLHNIIALETIGNEGRRPLC